MAISLDEIDVRLLSELEHDADRTNLELASVVGLSPAATLNRVKRLKESGVIRKVGALLDHNAAGFPLSVYVAVSLARNDATTTKRLVATIQTMPQVIAADDLAGELDYWLTVVARDVHDLEQVLAKLATRGAQRLTTYLRLKEIKAPSPLPLTPGKNARARAAG